MPDKTCVQSFKNGALCVFKVVKGTNYCAHHPAATWGQVVTDVSDAICTECRETLLACDLNEDGVCPWCTGEAK